MKEFSELDRVTVTQAKETEKEKAKANEKSLVQLYKLTYYIIISQLALVP